MIEPSVRFSPVAADDPEVGHRCYEPKLDFWLPLQTPLEGGAEVVELLREPAHRPGLVAAEQFPLGLFSEPHKVLGVSPPDLCLLAGSLQPLTRKLADRFQHP